MTEIRQITHEMTIDEQCNHCRIGLMRPTGIVDTLPSRYEHRCTNNACRHMDEYLCEYPYMQTLVYQVKDELSESLNEMRKQTLREVLDICDGLESYPDSSKNVAEKMRSDMWCKVMGLLEQCCFRDEVMIKNQETSS